MYIYVYIYILFFSFYYSWCDVLQDFINLINVDVDLSFAIGAEKLHKAYTRRILFAQVKRDAVKALRKWAFTGLSLVSALMKMGLSDLGCQSPVSFVIKCSGTKKRYIYIRSKDSFRPLPHPDIFESATFSFRIRLPSTRIWWIQHTNPQLFCIRSPEWKFLNTLWIVRTLNLDIVLIRWRNKIESSSLLWILRSRWQLRRMLYEFIQFRCSYCQRSYIRQHCLLFRCIMFY